MSNDKSIDFDIFNTMNRYHSIKFRLCSKNTIRPFLKHIMIVWYDQDEVGGGVLYVGGWDAAEDISGLQAAGVRAQ